MKIKVPSYFKDFKCIASACEDTCCAGWEVVIDKETHEGYQAIEGPFGEKLRSKIIAQEGENIFVLNGENCPFLQEDHLCEIYKEVGPEHLCYTCRQYPRYMEEFFELREMGISLSCPEAARILLGNQKPTAFEMSEDDQAGDVDDSIDEEALEDFFVCRDIMFEIIERDDLKLGTRAAIVLKLVSEVQDKIDLDELEDVQEILEKYTCTDYIVELVKELEQYKENAGVNYHYIHEYFKTYKALEHIHENDPLGLNPAFKYFWQNETDQVRYIEQHEAFNAYYKENMYKFKNILVYFIFRYFMKCIFDYDMSAKIKIALVSIIMIKELAVLRWIESGEFKEADLVAVSHMYSKDIEHLEENIETLQDLFETEAIYEADKIIMILMNTFDV